MVAQTGAVVLLGPRLNIESLHPPTRPRGHDGLRIVRVEPPATPPIRLEIVCVVPRCLSRIEPGHRAVAAGGPGVTDPPRTRAGLLDPRHDYLPMPEDQR